MWNNIVCRRCKDLETEVKIAMRELVVLARGIAAATSSFYPVAVSLTMEP